VEDPNFAAATGEVAGIPSLLAFRRGGNLGAAPTATSALTEAQKTALHGRAKKILSILGYHVSEVVDRMRGLIGPPAPNPPSAVQQITLDGFLDAVLDDLQIPPAQKVAFLRREAGLIYRSGKEFFLNGAEAAVVVRAATRGDVAGLATDTIKVAVNKRINDAALFTVADFACC
jgi:hypothetical protein